MKMGRRSFGGGVSCDVGGGMTHVWCVVAAQASVMLMSGQQRGLPPSTQKDQAECEVGHGMCV